MPLRRRAIGPAVAAAILLVAGCRDDPTPRPPGADVGDPAAGADAIEAYGCGACHRIPGIRRADSLVAPPLEGWGHRTFIAGTLANDLENLVRWIRDPDSVEPGTAMPDLGVTDADARDIAAYLLSLR
ncbi:c-type cytochrome [Acidimicrobiia bacterium EGI L10123]|uniref:c-type cytochrome n=1 Tax=Salinilacustrithrix flava TaxID=2957203 RepID=UPI003D7C15BD|nr:c-type cytochrome [Acidimicrobiia bacterium EGI L10123]